MEATKKGGVPLYAWMLLGFAVGMGGGLYVNLNGLEVIPWVMDIIQSVGQIFLRLLFMLVLPLLFAALAVGVGGIFMETHQDPDNAPSDGPCMVKLPDMRPMLEQLLEIDRLVKR